ncbi:MAG: PIN domain-containing protein [Chloroflexi bacterium]|nr:PIN domain-containing protein [Chloroflexota bacterium]
MGAIGAAALDRAIRDGERLLIDTSTLVAYLNRAEAATPVASYILDEMVHPGRNRGLVSMITVMDVLVRPLRAGTPEPYQHIMEFISQFPNLTPVPVDLPVAQEAASVRAMFRLSAPDALIVATGLISQVHHLVTNDATWTRKLQPLASRIKVCHLDAFR